MTHLAEPGQAGVNILRNLRPHALPVPAQVPDEFSSLVSFLGLKFSTTEGGRTLLTLECLPFEGLCLPARYHKCSHPRSRGQTAQGTRGVKILRHLGDMPSTPPSV